MPKEETQTKRLDKADAARILGDCRYKAKQLSETLEQANNLLYEGYHKEALEQLDLAIDHWNLLINMAPGGLKKVKLEYLLPLTERKAGQ